MLDGYANSEATLRYAKKFKNFSNDFFSEIQGLSSSSIGVGTFYPEPYKEESYTFEFKDSIKEAILNGANFIDTAINYRYQKSEREIKEALIELIDAKEIERDEVIIATKAGFVPLNYPFPENPYRWIEENIIKQKLAKKDEIVVDQHCITPKFLEYSLKSSLENLGVNTVDILFLHNPEMQLGYISYEELLKRIRRAFEKFEEFADMGKIKFYGVATWNGFTFEPEHMEYIKLKDLIDIAREIAGDKNRFKFIELPYNLAKPHPYIYTNQPLDDGLFYTPIQVAKKYGMSVIGSSSLLQMNLFKRAFSDKVTKLLGKVFVSDIQKAIQFTRSGVDVALFSSKDREHIRHNLELSHISKTSLKSYEAIFNL